MGFINREIKNENLIMDETGKIKILEYEMG
jgi:hypothetical protein